MIALGGMGPPVLGFGGFGPVRGGDSLYLLSALVKFVMLSIRFANAQRGSRSDAVGGGAAGLVLGCRGGALLHPVRGLAAGSARPLREPAWSNTRRGSSPGSTRPRRTWRPCSGSARDACARRPSPRPARRGGRRRR